MSTLNDNQLAEIRNKHIGFVFQNFYLLPKMTALDNVALPLLYAGVGQKERRARAKEALESVGWPTGFTFTPISFPAVSANGLPLPGQWWAARSCCWRTSPPALWIRRPVIRSWRFFAAWQTGG